MIKVQFLGTGTSQGIPIIGSTHPVCLSDNPKDKRLRVSVLIEWENTHLVIDCGPDFRQQMLRTDCTHLDAIFLPMNTPTIRQAWTIFALFSFVKGPFRFMRVPVF